jgi:phospholipid N-methyltransferase
MRISSTPNTARAVVTQLLPEKELAVIEWGEGRAVVTVKVESNEGPDSVLDHSEIEFPETDAEYSDDETASE